MVAVFENLATICNMLGKSNVYYILVEVFTCPSKCLPDLISWGRSSIEDGWRPSINL